MMNKLDEWKSIFRRLQNKEITFIEAVAMQNILFGLKEEYCTCQTPCIKMGDEHNYCWTCENFREERTSLTIKEL